MKARSLLIALPLTLSFACFAGEPGTGDPIDEEEEEEVDVQLSLDAAEGIESTGNIAIISGMFAAPAAADNPAEAAVQSVRDALADDGCYAISTDLLTFLEVTFDNCVVAGAVVVDGVLRADITRANSQTTFALSATDLVIGGTLTNGTWSVTPDRAAGTASFSGDLEFAGPAGASITVTAQAEIDVAQQCVDYSISGDIARVADASLSATNVRRCWGVCPASGDVSVSATTATRSLSLSWSYDGSGQITVTTESGISFPVALPCAK